MMFLIFHSTHSKQERVHFDGDTKVDIKENDDTELLNVNINSI